MLYIIAHSLLSTVVNTFYYSVCFYFSFVWCSNIIFLSVRSVDVSFSLLLNVFGCFNQDLRGREIDTKIHITVLLIL